MMQDRIKNPFRFGKEVTGYQFYDRVEDSRNLERRMIDGSSNVVLFAPRRYGKTSLVLKVLERLAAVDGIKSLCFDLTKTPSVEVFCQNYANAVYEAMKGHGDLVRKFLQCLAVWNPSVSVDIAGLVKFKLNVDPNVGLLTDSICDVLDLPEKISHYLGDIPFVIAFDEFQEVSEMSKHFPLEKIFRSCIQKHQNVRYVFLGSKTHIMKRMFGDATKPFYNSAISMPLGKPPVNESRDFIESRFREAGINISGDSADEIIGLSENIPYYLQEVASEVFEEVLSAGRDEVLSDDLSGAAEIIVARNAELYEVRLESFSDAKRSIVFALAQGPIATFDESCRRRYSLPVGSTLHTALPELVDAGIVERSADGYRLADPFFARYLRTSPAKVF